MRSTIFNAGARRVRGCRIPNQPCQSCRAWLPTRRFMSSDEKPYYITTPIFYVNAAPHVGHLSTMVLADVIKRWQVLKGKPAVLATGTDEHGLKIQQASAKAGQEPKPFCDKGAEVFQALAARANISNDHFVRTTDTPHKDAVQYAWLLLKNRGYIYASKHQGWYSVSDETFYPEAGIHLTLDPATGRKMMASIETGKEVEWTTEVNYHFKLSAFKDQLLEFYKENPDWIVPQFRMDEIVRSVSSGLEDLSISRPYTRLQWGIRVPDDNSQTIYVWLDALLNYATKVGYPWTPGQEHVGGWPADCHVIGKDISRFHCIYWPAFLMALSLPLPKRILTTAHWKMSNQKMSKSTGNVVNPFFALDRFGPDVMRYYLTHDGGISDDSNYSNYFVVERYTKGLQRSLGNLASRIAKGKGWSVPKALWWSQEHDLPGFSGVAPLAREAGRGLGETLESLPETADRHMARLDVSGALRAIMNTIYQTNKFLQIAQPWTVVEQVDGAPVVDAANEPHLHSTIFLCAESLRLAGILLQPWMPTKAAELLDMLNVDPQRRSMEWARLRADFTYGWEHVPKGLSILFPRLLVDEVPDKHEKRKVAL